MCAQWLCAERPVRPVRRGRRPGRRRVRTRSVWLTSRILSWCGCAGSLRRGTLLVDIEGLARRYRNCEGELFENLVAKYSMEPGVVE